MGARYGRGSKERGLLFWRCACADRETDFALSFYVLLVHVRTPESTFSAAFIFFRMLELGKVTSTGRSVRWRALP